MSTRQYCSRTDIPSINLARNLESLELAYWNQGLANYSDSDFSAAGLDGYRDYVTQFRDHEIVHFTVLNNAAGGGFTNCTYDTFDVYDIPSFLAQGQVVTSVGEGAFIGALGSKFARAAGRLVLSTENQLSQGRSVLRCDTDYIRVDQPHAEAEWGLDPRQRSAPKLQAP